jgi:hypothetical protein
LEAKGFVAPTKAAAPMVNIDRDEWLLLRPLVHSDFAVTSAGKVHYEALRISRRASLTTNQSSSPGASEDRIEPAKTAPPKEASRPSAADIALRQARAYITVDGVDMSNIDDDLMTIGPDKIPSIRLTIRNAGLTPAHNVRARVSARIETFPPPRGLFKLFPHGTGQGFMLAPGVKSVLEVGAGQPLNDSQKTLFGLGRLGAYLFGQIDYIDEFGEKRCTRFRMMAGGSVGFMGTAMHNMDEGNETDRNCEP